MFGKSWFETTRFWNLFCATYLPTTAKYFAWLELTVAKTLVKSSRQT